MRHLWETAEEQGVRLLGDCQAVKVVFAADQAVGVRVELPSGAHDQVLCSHVIDASGQSALLPTQLGLKQTLPARRQAIIWGIYEGTVRLPDILTSLTFPVEKSQAMFRISVLEGDRACLALFGDADYLLGGRGTPEEIFEDELVLCPALAERLIAARLVDRFFVGIRQAFSIRQSSGPGWRIIGDARQPADLLDGGALSQAILSAQQAAESLAPAARGSAAGRWFSASATNSPC